MRRKNKLFHTKRRSLQRDALVFILRTTTYLAPAAVQSGKCTSFRLRSAFPLPVLGVSRSFLVFLQKKKKEIK